MIARGELEVVQFGRVIRIPRRVGDRMLKGLGGEDLNSNPPNHRAVGRCACGSKLTTEHGGSAIRASP